MDKRLKILYLHKILSERTDEEHPMTMPEIIAALKAYGVQVGRKALYEDIEALRTFGLDVITLRGGASGYCVASREFELPELKLLADAVSSSRFLTEKKSMELLLKIERLASIHQAKQIHRQVFIVNRVKAMNERIYINVDAIHRAIAEKKKITFRYFDYGVDKQKRYRDSLRTCSPYILTWNDERYYVVSFYEKHPENFTNFRVDRMENVTVSDEAAAPLPEGFNVSEYLNSTFSMFSGETEDVKLRFSNSLVNAVIDRFGTQHTFIPDGDEHFTVSLRIKAQMPFLGWLFQFGEKAQIVAPAALREKYRDTLLSVAKQ